MIFVTKKTISCALPWWSLPIFAASGPPARCHHPDSEQAEPVLPVEVCRSGERLSKGAHRGMMHSSKRRGGSSYIMLVMCSVSKFCSNWLQDPEAEQSCSELETLQQENEALKAQMARLSSQLLEVNHQLPLSFQTFILKCFSFNLIFVKDDKTVSKAQNPCNILFPNVLGTVHVCFTTQRKINDYFKGS